MLEDIGLGNRLQRGRTYARKGQVISLEVDPGSVTAEVQGPAAGLATLDALLQDGGQHARRFQPARATRAHLLDQLGRSEEAAAAYDSAIDLTHDPAERQYLQHRRDRASRCHQRR